MKIVELPKVSVEKRKKIRHKNLEKNKHSYAQLKKQLVPKEMKLHQFRKWYHPTLSTKEKDTLPNNQFDVFRESIFSIQQCTDC